LAQVLGEAASAAAAERASASSETVSLPLGSSLDQVEAELIRQTLERMTSNRREAAAILGISVRSLQYKIKRYNLD
jgi:two-component system response regulator HydG